MHKYYWLFLVFIISNLGVYAQNCPASFSIGNDTTLCGGTSLLLLPDVLISDPLEVTWSPLTNLTTTPGNQEATVEPTVSTTYTLSVRSVIGPQLVANGDFSQGNTGFTSDYDLWTSSGNLDEGNYRVTTNPQNVHGDFATCSDNSPGTGNMLVVNASSDPDDIWCQNITVTAGATYAFSVALTTVVATNPAELQFRINGQLLGSSFNAPPTNCTWLEFFELWDSGSTTSAEICINNQNTASTGNDFAIDDISFQLTCLNEASITVTPAPTTIAMIETIPTLCERSDSIDLLDFLSPSTTLGGQFLLDNNPTTNVINPASLGAGQYTVAYVVGAAGCEERTEQTFTIDEVRSAGDFANGLIDEVMLCGVELGFFRGHLIVGFTGDPGGVFSISGGDTPADINSASGEITFATTPLGSFLIEYTIPAAGECPADVSDIIMTFHPEPDLEIGENLMLDCENLVQTISNSSIVLPGFDYVWTRNGDFFAAGQSITTSEGGTYELSASNSATSCESRNSVVVTERQSINDLDFVLTGMSCGLDNSLTPGSVAVTYVDNGTPPFLYSLNGGAFGADSLFSNLTPGQYSLSVEDAGGCTIDTTFSFTDPSDFIFNFTVEDNERIEFGTSLPVSVQTDLPLRYQDSITWFPTNIAPQGSNRIVATADSNLFYLASVITDEGCIFSDSLRLTPFAPQLIYAPNAFSPNGDGVNDNWTVFAHPAVNAIRSALIYDRWGNAVFVADDISGNNPEIGWDGKRNGKPLPVGSYLWTVEVEIFDGSKERFSGEIVLIR